MNLIYLIITQLYLLVYIQANDLPYYIQCHSSCKTCDGTSDNDCTSCEEGLLYVPSKTKGGFSCIEKCPTESGYYITDNKCLLCDPIKCKTCVGASEYDCTSCLEPLLKYVDPINKVSTCLEVCPIGFYTADNSCKKCSSNCLMCEYSEKCSICNYNSSLYNGVCTSNGDGNITFLIVLIILLAIILIAYILWKNKESLKKFYININSKNEALLKE